MQEHNFERVYFSNFWLKYTLLAGMSDTEAARCRLWEKSSKKILKADLDIVSKWLNLHNDLVGESETKIAILSTWSEIR